MPSPAKTVWRLAEDKFGALGPRCRPSRRPSANPDEWKSWHRYDVPGHRTIYVGENRQTAFAESLAWARRKVSEEGEHFDLTPYLDALYPGEDLWDSIDKEYVEYGRWHTSWLPRAWRAGRTCHELMLPTDGYFIDATHADTMTAIARDMKSELQILAVEEVDVPLLTGKRREVTCSVASWMHSLVLDDGSLPHGIRFPSRLGTGMNWAVWLRRIDDGAPVSSEPTKVLRSEPIEMLDSDFQAVLTRFGLQTH